MDDLPGALPPPPVPVAGTTAPPASRRRAPRARRIRQILTVLLALAVIAAFASAWVYDTLPQRIDNQQTLVLGQTRFAPGHEGAVRVVVHDARDQQPIPNADVKVSLVPEEGGKPVALFTGKTGEDGSLGAAIAIPASAQSAQTLLVETRSGAGRDQVRQPVTVERSHRLLLTTDKPVYQPTQTIHMRALALATLDMKAAAGEEIGFLVEDPKGNKVFRQTVRASEFGVAAADFTLADEVLNGDYKVSVTLGDTTSEKTVNVKPYVLPKFAVKITTEHSYYLPGQRVAGTVQCDYFFGKPVAGGVVEITGSVYDVEEIEVAHIRGRTDAQGTYHFELDLPHFFAGRGLEQDQAEFGLHVSVVDLAEHTEQASRVLPIAQEPLLIEVVPEAGVLKPGVENRLYILTSYPDGTPARTDLTLAIDDEVVQLSTGAYGLAEYAFVPRQGVRLAIAARDEQGQSARTELSLDADPRSEVVLLRPDRATYRIGDTMHLVALTSQHFGSLFLDIVKEGQTLSTRSQPVEDGQAEFAIDLSGDHFGALALHAYKVLADGSLIRDTRVVVVDAPRDVMTDIQADQEVYRPGETARLSFTTYTAGGPVQAALGVAIVDESVFAVMEQDPGFARLYFLLQKELLDPRYQVKGFTLPEILSTTVRPELQVTQDRAARAAWASLPAEGPSLNVNSRPLKMQEAGRARLAGLSRTANVTLVALVLVPLGLLLTTLLGLCTTGTLGRALGRFGLVSLVLLVVAPFACLGLFTLLALLSTAVHYAIGPAVTVLVMVGFLLSWLAAVVALALYAWLRRDERARIVWLLLAAWVALGVALAIALARGATPDPWLGTGAVLAYLVGLLTLLLFGVGLWLEGQRWAGGYAFAIVLLFIPAMISGAALPEVVRYVSLIETLGNPMVYVGPVGWLSGCAPAGPGGPGLPLPFAGDLFEGLARPAASDRAPVAEPEVSGPPSSLEQAPRVRQFFPETLLWLPELQTGADGFVGLDVPLADSITTWRVTALASTQDGQLGFSHAALRVFQDFFVDIDLPVALTQNDEVAIPVAVYNYLPEGQTVRLEVEPDDWFELQDAATKSLEIAANDIDVVYFRVKVLQFGEQAFQVTALGDKMSDAIRRRVAVVPDGRLFRKSESDWLRESTTVTTVVPTEAIQGTARIEVKIYPGVVAQVVEGLEKILRLPYGCFEQSTSVTYPNVLVLNYLNSTQTAAPEAQMRAESYVGTGYQRLLTFEAQGGGFALFGGGQADTFLSAYGLLLLDDMANVYPVDEALLGRTAQWLLRQQGRDGAWDSRDYRAGGGALGTTAFATWALADASYRQDPAVERAVEYIRLHAPEEKDVYILALAANALVAADPKGEATAQALDRLASLAVRDQEGAYWPGENTMMGGFGQTGAVETTALAAHALIRGGRHLALAQDALSFIVQSKDSWGTWGSTQATIWSLKALLQSATAGDLRDARATVRVSLNDGAPQALTFTPENADVVRVLTFDAPDARTGENAVSLELSGQGSLMYQVTAIYYLPWTVAPREPEPGALMAVDVRYDRTTLAVDELVNVTVEARLLREGMARMVLLDLGIPPGFAVQAEDLNALVARGTIERYDLTGRQIIVYLEDFSSEKTLTFSYQLRARFPLRAKTQQYLAYDYYNPEERAVLQPTLLTVEWGSSP